MRLFYCLELSSEVRESLYRLVEPLRRTEARVAWVRAANLHITLKFLGELEPTRWEPLRALGAELARKMAPFELCFDKIGAFPNWARPRVLWIGALSPPEAVLRWQRDWETALQKLGFAAEDRFTPHVTLGRIKDGPAAARARLAESAQKIKPFAFHALVSSLTLMESRLTPEGAIYTPLNIFPLVGAKQVASPLLKL